MSLSLRPLTESDVSESYAAWLNDSTIRKYLGIRHLGSPTTTSDIRAFIEMAAKTQRYHWGMFVGAEHVGNVSCSAWNRNDRWIDISYVLGDQRFQGKGLTTIAVGAAINYLFTNAGFHRIQAECSVENIGSIKIMEKLGMRKEALFRQKLLMPEDDRFVDEVLYSVLQPEWKMPIREIADVRVAPMIWESRS